MVVRKADPASKKTVVQSVKEGKLFTVEQFLLYVLCIFYLQFQGYDCDKFHSNQLRSL